MRTILGLMLVVHGGIHFLGFAKAFGLLKLPQLTEPATRAGGLLWLAAGVLMIASVFAPPRVFWIIGGLAALLSQVLIMSAWQDAKAGTLANVIVLLAAALAFASAGPMSFAQAFASDAAAVLARVPPSAELITEAHLERLPQPVQRYLRVTGTVGQPRISNFRVRWRGRIREAADAAWMPFEAEQLSTLTGVPTRMFFMQATMKHLPVDIYHRFVGADASFRVRLLSMFQLLSAAGPELNRSETVTILNDLCLLAPSALLDPSVRWLSSDASSARLSFTRGAETVDAELRFNGEGQLVDFVSDDRLKSSADGKSFSRLRWSTPILEHRALDGGRRVSARGEARWHAPEGSFAYLEIELTDIRFNVAR